MSPAVVLMALGLAPAAGSAPPTTHDLHITYGNLAVEGNVVVYQMRAFKDDLTAALAGHSGKVLLDLAADPEVDGVFLDYLGAHLRLRADGRPLTPKLLASGEDNLDREPVWWYQVQYEAERPIRELAITNTILFELFDDQRNILKVVHFPTEEQRTYYFAPGEDSIRIAFPLQ